MPTSSGAVRQVLANKEQEVTLRYYSICNISGSFLGMAAWCFDVKTRKSANTTLMKRKLSINKQRGLNAFPTFNHYS